MKLPKPPVFWGLNGLTDFLDNCRLNQFATFANKVIVRDLIDINSLQLKSLSDFNDPDPEFPLQFLFRAHSAYLAACSLAMSGQVVEAFPTLRLALESAAYGVYIGGDGARALYWLNRHESETDKKKFRDVFSSAKVKRCLETEYPLLAGAFTELYERTIDYGAHPNERGFSVSTQLDSSETGRKYTHVYAHEDGPALDLALKTCGQVGLWALLAFSQIYSARWRVLGAHEMFNRLILKF